MLRLNKKTVFAMTMAFLVLTGCNGLQLLDWVTPDEGYTRRYNIAYNQENQKLDVYIPRKPDAKRSVVLFFYGGSWQRGSKDLYRFVGQSLAKKGYTTVIADYRTYPENYFPSFMYDAADSLTWTRKNIGEYGGDNNRIFVAGHSAGAHIAMLLTLDQKYIKKTGGDPDWIRGTIGVSGPYDFLPLEDPKIIALFSKVPIAETQPINFVRKDLPPILLLHGTADDVVYQRNSDRMAVALRKLGNKVVYKTYPGIDHTDIAAAFSWHFKDDAPTLKDFGKFIDNE